jgi:hypothetical protein
MTVLDGLGVEFRLFLAGSFFQKCILNLFSGACQEHPNSNLLKHKDWENQAGLVWRLWLAD